MRMRRLRSLPERIAARPRVRAGLLVVIGNLIGAAAAFAAAIVAARVLSLDEFAALGVGLAVNSLAVQFADLGLGTVAIAEAADSADSTIARAKLRSLTLHRARTAVLVGVLISAVVLLLPSLEPYRTTAMVAAGGEVFGCLAFFFIWSLQGERSFLAAGSLQAVQGLMRLALVGACAVAGLGATAMMVGYAVIAPALVGAVGAVMLFARAPRGGGDASATGSAEVDLDRRRVMAATGIAAAMLINGDVLLLTMIAGQTEVAAYAAAWRFASGLLLINTAIASSLLPFIVTAPDAWVEAKLLVRRGLAVSAGWFALLPLMAFVGPLLLGSVGEEGRGPMIVLLVAFAIDGFYFILYQIYLRVRKVRFLLVAALLELVTMVAVTLLLQEHGALAPAYGQLAARVAVCALTVTPLLLAHRGRLDWFSDDRAVSPQAQR